MAARHADVYLTWGEPPDAVREKVEWIRGLAAAQGRAVRFGIRLHTISRDSSAQAWQTADQLVAALDEETVRAAQAGLARSQSEGQRRMVALHEESRRTRSWRDARSLEIAPNLWSGVGLVRGGAGTALVGSHTEVADRIAEYAAVGIDEFIFSGYPHLEELFWFGEGVVPILRARGLLDAGALDTPAVSVPFVGWHVDGAGRMVGPGPDRRRRRGPGHGCGAGRADGRKTPGEARRRGRRGRASALRRTRPVMLRRNMRMTGPWNRVRVISAHG